MNKKKWNYSRIAHWLFTIFLLFVSLYLIVRSFSNSIELSLAYGTTNYYVSILKATEGSGFDTEHVTDYMLYAYRMRKPSEPKSKTLERIMERTEHFAMLAITQRLAKETGENFGSDFDAWVERFASEEEKRIYKDIKEYRLEKGINANPLELPAEQ